jgi:hypothetical protein
VCHSSVDESGLTFYRWVLNIFFLSSECFPISFAMYSLVLDDIK